MARRRVDQAPAVPAEVSDEEIARKTAENEERIKQSQDEAIARSRAKAEEAKPSVEASGGAGALGSAFFGTPPAIVESTVPRVTVAERTSDVPGNGGDVVEAVLGEEMYGMKGTFSSYRVGSISGKTTVEPGETRKEALRRLLADLREVQAEERIRAKEAFLSHFPTAFEKA